MREPRKSNRRGSPLGSDSRYAEGMAGRQQETDRLASWYRSGAATWAVVSGDWGAGKTTFVRAFASRLPSNSTLEISAWARNTDLREVARFARRARDKPVLLAIDDLDRCTRTDIASLLAELDRVADRHTNLRIILSGNLRWMGDIAMTTIASGSGRGFLLIELGALTPGWLLQARDSPPELLVSAGLDGRLRADWAVPLDSQFVTIGGGRDLATPYLLLPHGGARFWQQPLDDFRGLLADPEAPESAYQLFFEKYPELLAGHDYTAAIPHPTLQRAGDRTLVPDFLLATSDGFADVLELKRPTAKAIVGRDPVSYGAAVSRALSQALQYVEYMGKEENRAALLERYQVDAYYPGVIVVVGRTPPTVDRRQLRQLQATDPRSSQVWTYDDLYLRMKAFAGEWNK